MNTSLRRIIVGVCGQNGSGKSTVCDFLQAKGFSVASLSDEIRRELSKRGIPETRENLIKMGTELRDSFGHGVLAERIVSRLDDDTDYVIDSVRHPAEVQALRNSGRFRLVCVKAPVRLRFERLQARKRLGDSKTYEEFEAADRIENEHPDPAGQQLRKTMELADVTIENDCDIDTFNERVRAAVEMVAQ